MKKILLTLLMGLVAIPVSASLWNYYNEMELALPSVSDRALLALQCGISDYRGTYDQNIKLEECLRNNGDFTPELGAALASSDLTQIVADFRSSLAQKLSVGGNTMTLQSVVDDDGVTLASGKYSFTLDGSSSNKEYVICDLNPSTKVCSNIVNVSRQGVRTSGAVREHRVGSAVTITDYTSLKYHNDILEGVSSTTGGLLLGNGKISGLYNLDGTFTWLKYNTSTSNLQWSPNGSDFYNFTSSSITQLTASTTAGIGVTDSKIYIKASSTLGGAFDDNGSYYQKVSSTQGLQTDSNGIGINYAYNNTWTGTNTFGTTTFNVSPVMPFVSSTFDGIIYASNTTSTVSAPSSTVTYTVRRFTIPLAQYSLGANDQTTIDCHFDADNSNNSETFTGYIYDGTATTTLFTVTQSSGYYPAYISSRLIGQNSTSTQRYITENILSGGAFTVSSGQYSIKTNSDWIFTLNGVSDVNDNRIYTSNYCNVYLTRAK